MAHTKDVNELVAQIETALRWMTTMQEEIRSEGHAGWGNTLDDVAATLREAAALLTTRVEKATP